MKKRQNNGGKKLRIDLKGWDVPMKRLFRAIAMGTLLLLLFPASVFASDTIEWYEGPIKCVSYADEDGNIIFNEALGYATVKMLTDEYGNIIEEYYYDADGAIIKRAAGNCGIRRVYEYHEPTESFKCVQYTYVDEKGLPVMTTSGISTSVRTFDREGRVFEEYYYDTEMVPTRNSSGVYGCRNEYNEEGRLEWEICLDKNGDPLRTDKGYTCIYYEYDQEGSQEYQWYCDENREPCNIGRGQYGIHIVKNEEGKSSYIACGSDGRELFFLDRFLGSSPIIVVLAAIVSIVLAALLKGRWKYLLLILSAVLILYMTLLTRESCVNEAVKYQLFSSYAEALEHPASALQILDNIALFVPFGAALMSLIKERPLRSLFICTGMSFAFSLAVEAIQLIFRLGVFEVDDILNNTIGGFLGALCLIAFSGLIVNKKLRK